jgi:histidinol-phosphate aminotransferase
MTKQDPLYRQPSPRSGFETLSTYDGVVGECSIDLSDNTNLWGMPPSARKALEDFSFADVTRYPSAYTSELKESIARYVGVDSSMIVTGCGSDDVLDSAIRAFGNSGGTLTCCEPTFSMIPVLARINGLAARAVPFDAEGDIAVDALLSAAADIIYVCSPNNPTGSSASVDRINTIADQFRGLVIVDQAYAEYSAISLTHLVADHSNVLITRTMSKAFGMAGLRVGYAIGNPALVNEVEKSRGPYKVGALSSTAAIAALEHDIPWIEQVVDQTLTVRSRFVDCIQSLGYRPLPSDANFLLIPTENATSVANRMLEAGIGIRSFRNLPGIGDALRITMAPWPMMEQVLTVLEAQAQ